MSGNASSQQKVLIDERFRDFFVDGYCHARALAGDRPSYGYPANHLPKTTGSTKIKTIFMA
jgi:hypothetical protein